VSNALTTIFPPFSLGFCLQGEAQEKGVCIHKKVSCELFFIFVSGVSAIVSAREYFQAKIHKM
jgi:hypothetical protein